ncbi:MAG: tRNA uridine(34) 5-carboxymethylaminomethyl modification radical SAM/GNAT enzyme Elp3 [Anaerolineae bacterium]|nr:MAG: tRNA uridine(34) 5-carboxymethylaminomethyl modification radical SAM/GNAT enzyme Elp3 [Anaerolineae bacterium]
MTKTPGLPHAQTPSWQATKRHSPERLATARLALEAVRDGMDVFDAIQRFPIPTEHGGGYIGKHHLVAVYRELVESDEWEDDPALLGRIRMKPMRTQSGVTVVTVLTKPYPCPGKCVFCPTDFRMPKSYLPDEPGAMRALHYQFDPYAQVAGRIAQLEAVGHPTDKIELIILGGTWSSYRKDYQEWFVKELFAAMNGLPPTPEPPDTDDILAPRASSPYTLVELQAMNETAAHRNVGLVIETRPDHVNPAELDWLRTLGVTKVQLGAQSLDDRILDLNQRGHSVAATHAATALLRAAGFKIVLHWMPNLLGATPEGDRLDFAKLWDGLCPDEIKIYPCQLLENADLYLNWQRGEYHPYSTQELIDLIADVKPGIPRYCRVNRVIRDIPSTNVVEGNRNTSLRMDVHRELARRGQRCQCLRCREVRGQSVKPESLEFNDLAYAAEGAEEHFLSFDTPDDRLAGFLRLSLPGDDSPATGLTDLAGAAIIREVHVYGQSLEVGEEQTGAAQHIGLGTRLIAEAERIARAGGYERLAVIAAVGTRRYYEGRGFNMGARYMVKDLVNPAAA